MNRSPDSLYPSWLRAIKRIERSVYKVEKLICILSLAVMAISTGFTVLARYMHLNVPNYGELGLASVIPLTLIGGAMCTYLGGHITVEIVQSVPNRFLRNFAEIFSALCAILFAYFFISSGWVLIEEFRLTNDKLLDLGTPLYWLASFFPIGMILIIFHSVVCILSRLYGVSAIDEQERFL